ncbi:hypothetical protein PMAC_001501 [Pneumocystis sp. 'macacae']|nr:hypothetical protein PMAC_001501 [Pneumocystis sp. 'macacae']
MKDNFSNVKKKPKISAAQIRIQKDITELLLPKTIKIEFPNPNDLLNFYLTICPDEGFYKNGSFRFKFNIDINYPHNPPKVKCLQKIYHPNIDLYGNVCLNILREDWKPVLNLSAIIFEDPLNKVAADDLRNNQENFRQNVQISMKGGYVYSEIFENVIF